MAIGRPNLVNPSLRLSYYVIQDYFKLAIRTPHCNVLCYLEDMFASGVSSLFPKGLYLTFLMEQADCVELPNYIWKRFFMFT